VGHPLAAELRELELIRRFRPLMNRQGKNTRRKSGYLCIGHDQQAHFEIVDDQPTKTLFEESPRSWGPLAANRRLESAVHELNLAYRLIDSPWQDLYEPEKAIVFTDETQEITFAAEDKWAGGSERHERIEAAISFLKGENDGLVPKLQEKMEDSKRELNFHAAARWRDQWQQLELLQNTIEWQCHPQKYDFVYAPTIGRKQYWFVLSRSQVLAVGCAPSDAASAKAITEKMQTGSTAGDPNAAIDRGQQRILNRWFRQHPHELESTLSGAEARNRCDELQMLETFG